MADPSADGDALELVERMRIVIQGTNMDGHCREMLSSAFDRFLSMEARRLSKRLLQRVRGQRERIAAIVTMLSELDHVNENESDRSVFAEMALLFDEISLTAVAGSAALREIDRVKAEFPLEDRTEPLEEPIAQWSPGCAAPTK
ncbi:hypothetical protein HNR60_003960 [Rhodopseudomonas rhenobacensis]|uniref:Uncharacterized protein n=1 Tax=Rhodopseudomonas rhenobacensis TaxID=87461 RepID=A0A7W7Z7D5_9BRAD|nr:hypothetical protein [Rhodopseudomonas rhenobacensis]MBB5049185.1 hypothetical protein [Rhodopseudomonas rhenobacensis]